MGPLPWPGPEPLIGAFFRDGIKAGHDPVNGVDPSGEMTISEIVSVVGTWLIVAATQLSSTVAVMGEAAAFLAVVGFQEDINDLLDPEVVIPVKAAMIVGWVIDVPGGGQVVKRMFPKGAALSKIKGWLKNLHADHQSRGTRRGKLAALTFSEDMVEGSVEVATKKTPLAGGGDIRGMVNDGRSYAREYTVYEGAADFATCNETAARNRLKNTLQRELGQIHSADIKEVFMELDESLASRPDLDVVARKATELAHHNYPGARFTIFANGKAIAKAGY